MLSDDFDVVGVATDGTKALDKAGQVHPDVIVLDVEMPGLNGFQTFRALEQGGFSATPVVFLSMHDADEIVSEAFRCGGRGYVLKQRVGRDLRTRSTRRSSAACSCRRSARSCLANGGAARDAGSQRRGVIPRRSCRLLRSRASARRRHLRHRHQADSRGPRAIAFGPVAGTSADRPGTNGISPSTRPTR